MPKTTPGGLTADQVAQFQREGWLLVESLLPPGDLEPLIAELEAELDRRARDLQGCGELTDLYEHEGFTTRLTRLTAQTEAVYWSLVGGQYCGPGMFELLRHPRILDAAESLLGPELIASSAFRLRPKVPGFEHGVVPWHQDSGYFEPACDDALILTVWLPLVDATPENGCLVVLPRMHTGPVVTHYQANRYLAIADELLPLDQAVTVPVPKGGALLLSNRTPHCSTDNTTDVVRWSVDLRYQGAGAPSPAWPEDLRAEAVAATRDRTDLPELPLSCYAPEADFLIRSRRHPEAVVQTAEAFQAIRRGHRPGASPARWR